MSDVVAIKLKKDIWFLRAGQVYYYEKGELWSKEPNNEPIRTLDGLAQAIMSHVEGDDEYIEVLSEYDHRPPQYINDMDGNKYKLVTKDKSQRGEE